MMKKYWKLFMLCIFTFSLLSIHYVQAARETSDYLTLRLKTISGDESVVAERTFYGSYSQSRIYQSAVVKQNGAKTALNGLYVYELLFPYLPIEMQPITEQYRSFMRGKIVHPVFYYEDEQRLLYVDIPTKDSRTSPMPITFYISSLTKEEGKQVDYTAKTLQSFPFTYVSVEEVQLVDGNIKVLANAFEAGRGSMMYVFTIDEKTRTVMEYNPLTTSEVDEDYILYRKYADYSPQTNFLYGSASYGDKVVEATPNSATTQDGSIKDFKLFKIDLNTMATAAIDVPEAVRYNSSNSAATNDATHFVVNGENNALQLYSYHFDNDEWTHIELESSFDVKFSQVNVFVVDDVLYISHENYEDSLRSFVDAYDVTSGKQLYRGEIISKSDEPFYFRMSSMK